MPWRYPQLLYCIVLCCVVLCCEVYLAFFPPKGIPCRYRFRHLCIFPNLPLSHFPKRGKFRSAHLSKWARVVSCISYLTLTNHWLRERIYAGTVNPHSESKPAVRSNHWSNTASTTFPDCVGVHWQLAKGEGVCLTICIPLWLDWDLSRLESLFLVNWNETQATELDLMTVA